MSEAFYVSYAALWALVVLLTLAVVLLYRHFGMMALGTLEGVQRDGLDIGAPGPPIVGVTPEGVDLRWEAPGDRAALVLFAAPGCGPCSTVIPFANVVADSGRVEVLGVTAGPRQQVEQLTAQYDCRFQCIAEDASGALANYRVRVTPFAFVLRDGRVYAKGLCSGAAPLRELLIRAGLDEDALLVEQAAARDGNHDRAGERVIA